MSEDRIEKHVVVHAPRERIWKVLADAEEFGRWFGARFEGPFVAGRSLRGVIAPSVLDTREDIASHPYQGKPMVLHIERMDPPSRFSFRWHPLEVRSNSQGGEGPSTLVEFTLEETKGGTKVTVVESGFSKLPAAERHPCFESHDGGWAIQVQRIRTYSERS